MAKIYNISDKLSTENKAIIKVFETELEFKTDAETVFNALEIADEDMGVKERYMKLHGLLFTKRSAKDLMQMKLPFSSYQKVVETAFDIAIGRYGEDPAEQGEPVSRAMT